MSRIKKDNNSDEAHKHIRINKIQLQKQHRGGKKLRTKQTAVQWFSPLCIHIHLWWDFPTKINDLTVSNGTRKLKSTLNLPPLPNHFASCLCARALVFVCAFGDLYVRNFVVRYAELASDDLMRSSEFRKVVVSIRALHFIYFMAINSNGNELEHNPPILMGFESCIKIAMSHCVATYALHWVYGCSKVFFGHMAFCAF